MFDPVKAKLFAGMLLLAGCCAGQNGAVIHSDSRFKADLLVVVAHPDDESAIGGYLARAIFDQHKRVAVIFGTRGNTGGNAYGQEQAASLGLIREIEGRRALATFGVANVWFLNAPDTPGQDVLRALENWNHGSSLEQVVRIVRLTQPAVIATWLPDYTAGENHGDHQAASVLATEAFDAAGDPSRFPAQVTPARNPWGIGNGTEGLQPWQPQKIYYFTDASHVDFLEGKGPTYSALDISPAKHESYALLAAEECSLHLTQIDSGAAAKHALDNDEVAKTYFADPSRLLFGKSHVPSSITGDLFEGVTSQISYTPVSVPATPAPETKLALWGPWYFYANFWREHGLEHLSHLVPPEVLCGASERVTIPIRLPNTGNETLSGDITVSAPPGWKIEWGLGAFHIEPGSVWSAPVVLVAPAQKDADWKDITISAKSPDGSLGSVSVRVQVAQYDLPQ